MKTMRMGLLGKKIGMTRIFKENVTIPITVIETGPCAVTKKKSPDKDGYGAIQIGFDECSEKKMTKPVAGQFQKSKVSPRRVLNEIRLSEDELAKYAIGQEIKVDSVFSAGDIIDVVGTSKGSGFTGVIKRHNFKSFKETHGTHEVKRHGGSIGAAFPQHVLKGTRMAGQHGNSRTTLQNLEIVEVRPDENLLFVKGSIPGAKGGYVMVKKAVKL
ncbi:MAG: 50S ribosomal protein L3 [Candidatus Theseobacter exili]|nr:50S ribosomal protein L3 [Candidatus Theseobacter exili]